jgi:citrate lyase subunit beta/citryl-CoA lyase
MLKAAAAAPDGIILDLEDAVAREAKEAARSSMAEHLKEARPAVPLFIRINPSSSPWFDDDIAAAARLAFDGIMLPKCESGDEVLRIVEAYRLALPADAADSEPVVLPIVETPRGVLTAFEIASAHPAVIGLAFGAEDLTAALRARRTSSGREVFVARSQVVLAVAAAGGWAIDSPSLEFRRLEVVRREAALARALGFVGKLLIHPGQVSPVHEAFRVDAAELERALQTVAAMEGNEGVGSADGRMVDRPVLLAAQQVIRLAARDRRVNESS